MRQVHILLVEDNEGDILLTTEALEEGKITNNLSVVKNGKDELDFMFKRGVFKEVNSPDLILLDINLPLKNGHEVLDIVKTNEKTQHIPVIMLTTSSSENDIKLAYKHHANCYITKPVEVEDFIKAVASIEDFWFNLVLLPKE